MLYYSKPQACATYIATAATVGAIETFEDTGEMFFTDAGAIVRYFSIYMFAVHFVNTCGDTTAIMTVFNCVLYQVYDYLFYFRLIGINFKRAFSTCFYQ